MPQNDQNSQNSKGYVAYYRVSTQKQGDSGLGLEAQQAAVLRFVRDPALLLAEFTEIESGKRHTNRPELAAAIRAAKRLDATLTIAKLDRLARNVHFISGLMESEMDFVACDMPEANRLTLHVMAAFAEHEARAISQRTKAALEAAKARGTKLGNPRWKDALQKAEAAKRMKARPLQVITEMLAAHRASGRSFRQVADAMNQLGIKTLSGARWHPSSVRAALLADAALKLAA
jgi:DNA invertase Pin-like site-specific DNA recombinase